MTVKSLFDVATVERGDGTWTHGYDAEVLTCGRSMSTADVCSVEPQTPSHEPHVGAYRIEPFAQIGDQEFPTRCAPADAEAALTVAMEKGAEHFVAANFWNGDVPDWTGAEEGVFLTDDGVATVAAGSTVVGSIVAALALAYENHPDLVGSAIVHLGLGASYALPPGLTDEHPTVTFVESSGYPLDGVAVTGPVLVKLGTVETIKTTDQTINRQFVSATRLVAVEFDPCLAVVVS